MITQLKDRVVLIKFEVKQLTDERDKLVDFMKSLLSNKYQKNVATLPCSRRVIGAIAALKAGAGLILRDRLKEAACTTVSNFKLGDDTSILTKEVEDIFQKQLETIATLQRVQSAKDENFSLLGHEVRTTQEIVINLLGTINDRLQTLDRKFTLIQGELTLYKEFSEKKNETFPLPSKD